MNTKKDDPLAPKHFSQARKDPNWAAAIDRELNSLKRRHTWNYIKPMPNQNPVPFTWNFRLKESPGDKAQIVYKARCCLRGDKQRPYVDYDPANKYAPVVRHKSIRMLLSITESYNLLLEGADSAPSKSRPYRYAFSTSDVDNACLYGDIGKPIIMEQPYDRNGQQEKPGYHCQLLCSIYGAVQAGEIWGGVINSFLITIGFQQSKIDAHLYFYRPNDDNFMVLVIVVDDMVFAAKKQSLINEFKSYIYDRFNVKLLGCIKYFMGWNIDRDRNGIYVSQSKYIRRMIKENNLSHLKPLPTPLPFTVDISAAHGGDIVLKAQLHNRFRSIIGALLYAAVCNRTDISFETSVLARYMHALTERHYNYAKRILRYLLGTIHYRLKYPAVSGCDLNFHCDADWAGCLDTRKSTTGFIGLINGSPIVWSL